MAQERAWLIDASIYIFRAWFSMPDNWRTAQGQPVSAVYGYTRFLIDFIARVGTQFHGAAAFDESLGSNYRNDIYPAYKSSRELPEEVLAFQLQACRKVTELIGLPCYGGPRFEADDYLASLASRFRASDIPVTVVTRDKDLGQIIVHPEDRWWDYAADEELNAGSFAQKFGVTPAQFADYLALVGDPIDDIPGVPGIGAKTASKLLQAFGDINGIKQSIDDIPTLGIRGGQGVKDRLVEHWTDLLVWRQLTALECNIPELGRMPTFTLQAEALEQVASYLTELGMDGPLIARLRKLAPRSDR
ncbi:MAG: 5'-3' exonuclease [Bacteroidia bacterium]|jgi:5'-3' exonuclease